MTKKEKKQFNRLKALATRKVELANRDKFREGITTLEKGMFKSPVCYTGKEFDMINPLKHSFGDGCYIREIFMPKGQILVTKIHKITHPYFIMSGDISIGTESGLTRIKAPYQGITKVGTKRIIYTHEDTVFITVHATKETDLKKIEEEVIAKDFEEIDYLESQKYIDIVFNEKEEQL